MQRILRKKGRIGDNGLQFLFERCFVATAEDELRDEFRRPAGGLTQGDAESDEILRVHELRAT